MGVDLIKKSIPTQEQQMVNQASKPQGNKDVALLLDELDELESRTS